MHSFETSKQTKIDSESMLPKIKIKYTNYKWKQENNFICREDRVYR